jgi:pantoate--beta-alanine ligase
MEQVITIKEMRAVIVSLRQKGESIGFVPTMGFLHEGHCSLIREAARACDRVVVSIFVNPLQFGPGEDFARYPRDLKGDFEKCLSAGAHLLFLPEAREIIGEGSGAFIRMDRIMDILCGASRPGHFQGVAAIVLKLLNIVQPDCLFLGAKDFQQTVVIQKMIHDFFIPVKIDVRPTVREPDGLAMSSRNSYLSREERKSAAVLFRAMKKGEEAFLKGDRKASVIKPLMENEIRKESAARIDYLEVVSPETLEPLDDIQRDAVILLAVWIGKTRLIDNLKLS